MFELLPQRQRRAKFQLCVAAVFLTAITSTSFAQYLVTQEAAGRLGLERAWFAQIRVDPAAHRVVHWLLDRDQLFALTSDGTIQAFNAETGETLWTTEVGIGHAPAAGIAVNAEYIALLGSGRLYIMNRVDGHHFWSRQVGGAASAAPALSDTYAYVVLTNGRVEGYPLDDPTANVWQYQSYGRTFQSPTITGKVVSWPSDRGLLYVGTAESPKVMFRVETNDEIVAAPAEQAPYLYVASLDGYLYCFHELTGGEQWRYSTGFAVTSQPAIVGDMAFVASEGATLHAVNAVTGQRLWRVNGAVQFVALGKHHTYGMDRYGTLLVLDSMSGGIAGRLRTSGGGSALVNDQSDRIFLTNDRGLVQCLHEIGAAEPTWHRTGDEGDEATTDDTAKAPADAIDAAPASDEETPAGEASDSPFEPEGAAPETDEFDDENPFD